ncbi:ATP-binding protein [Niveispirillum sp. KHB5.9]|uniref:PAS domain-containing sensor histidine kinase n=1 Tax=Niveispirillum sp. KHB5.9 TaxID=3400269 RepID=UPI003A851853
MLFNDFTFYTLRTVKPAFAHVIAIAAAALLGLAGIGWMLLPILWEAQSPVLGLLTLALLLTVASLFVRLLAWCRGRDLDLVESKAENARLLALLDASPDPWFAQGVTGDLALSPGFAGLLGLDQVRRLDDVEQALAPSDAAALHGSFRHLVDSGQPFQINVRLADGSKFFQASGRRGGGPEGACLHLLWLRDITVQGQDQLRRQELHMMQTAELERLRTLLSSLPIPLWRRGASLDLDWCNAAYAHLLDSTPERVLEGGRELPGGGLFGGPRDLAMRARDAGAAQEEERFLVVDGDRRLFHLTEIPLPQGGMIGMAVDRTTERGLKDELTRHIDAHGEVLHQMGSAIAIYGPDMRIKFHNHAYARLWDMDTGWLADEPTYGEVLEDLRARRKLTEEADFPRWKKQQLGLFTSLIEPMEELIHLPDGRTLRALSVPHPFGGLMFVTEDVTHTLALESSYNTLMAVQQETLDNLAEGVAVFGGDGRLKLCNPAFQRLWAVGSEQVRGEPHASGVVDLVRPLLDQGGDWEQERVRLVGRLLERAADAGIMRRVDGSVLRYALVPLPDGAVLFSCLDVTDSDRVETALRSSNEALEAADRLKAEFIANVSYQLRTPLNAIMGFAEILHNQYFGPLNNRQQEYAKGVLEASRRLLSLVNDILDLATIEAGFMVLEHERFDIPQLLHSVAGLTRDWARKQGLDLRVDVPEHTGAMEGDEKRLKQALFNLVSNAIKFTPAGGRITLSAERRGDRVVLAVSDTGLGIASDEQSRVFERFERGSAGAAGSTGAGLGLSLVKSFIELHGGSVEIDSDGQTGSTIRCCLPAALSTL